MAYDATDFVVTDVPAPETAERANMRYLAGFLRLNPERFDYENSGRAKLSCGTPACVLGWARAFAETDNTYSAYAWMGLGIDDGHELCFRACTGSKLPAREITGTHAANVLDHYLATGKIDWSVA